MSEQKPAETSAPVAATQSPAAPATPKTSTRKAPEIKALESAPIPAGVAPKVQIRNRHDLSFRHDVFASDVKQGFRNVSYEYQKPNLVPVDHKHIYHSHNNQGKKLSRTGSAAGHWHDVTHYVDKDGTIVAKCGPAMHEVTNQTENGRVFTRIEPVAFEEEVTTGEENGKIRKHVDDHVHEMFYLGSEELSPMGIAKDLQEQQAAAAAHGIQLGAGSVKDNTPAPLNASDGVTMTEA